MEAVQAIGGRDLIRRAGDALREPSTDVPISLERLAAAIGSGDAVVVRCVGRAVVVDAAWRAGDPWSHRTAVIEGLSPEAVRDLDTEPLIARVMRAIPELQPVVWRTGRVPEEPFFVALSDPGYPLTPTTMDALATALNLLMARDLAAAAARMNALLRERARIASDIHQGVCQEMATLNLQLQILDELLVRDPASASALLTEIERSAQLCAESLRSAIVHLTPATPDGRWLDGGLQRLVRDFCETWAMTMSFEVVGPMRVIEPDALALVFAFVQEGLTNMRKHAASRDGAVRVSFDEQMLRVDVIDRASVGARRDPAPVPFGHGLSLMRGRARLLGGDVEFRPGPHGTRFSLEIPI